MAHPLTVPKLGLTMIDCTLVEWAKSDADKVAVGDILYTVETDKIANDIEADAEGYLQRVAAVDSVHGVGAIVGYLHETKEAALSGAVPAPAAGTRQAAAAADAAEGPVGPPPPDAPTMRADVEGGRRILISPVARRIAGENGLPPGDLDGQGSGPGGAILRRDVERRLKNGSRPVPQAVPTAAPAGTVSSARAAAGDNIASSRPLAGIRRTIASRMMQSLQGSAQMTGFGRVDMGEAVRLRNALAARESELGVRVTYTDIVVKAVATVLMQMPQINAAIVGDEIVEWADANIGIAVAIDNGLIVPVVHRANAKSLVEIARERRDLVARARSGGLDQASTSGGTFSVSNFGSYGGDFETPILNPPQSALLGIGQIADEPAVRDGQIVIRPMMMLSMTFDHRLIDGADAGRFRARLRAYLEDPALQMAELR